MDHVLIALLDWLVAEDSALLAGFIGGALAQAVVLLSTKGESAVPRSVRVQIVLIWMVIVGLLLINIAQGRNIQQLLTGTR